jgi:hypothetical protein
MVWTEVENIRLLTGLDDTDIEDDNLEDLISVAQKEVLLQINNKVIREQVEYIDETRTNDIDGSNKTFYVKKWKGNYLSDNNFDLSITTSDIEVFSVSSGVESSITPATIVSNQCKFTTAAAPSNIDMYVSYSYSSFDADTPNPLLKLAAEYLAASYAYLRIESSQNKQIKFGNVSITSSTGKDSPHMLFYNKYLEIIRQLNENSNMGAIWGESKVLI